MRPGPEARVDPGRKEHRMAVSMSARLVGGEARYEAEKVSIENISLHGARVRTHRELRPHEHVILAGSGGEFYADAEVVYCERVREGLCAVGLKFARALEGDQPGRLFP